MKKAVLLTIVALVCTHFCASGLVLAQEERILLDEGRPEPPPKEVRRYQDQATKYSDGTVHSESDYVRMSNDEIINDGDYTEYYRNGNKFAQGTFKMGIHHGKWTYWHENGEQCKQVTFDNGKPDGTWKVYDEQGKLMAKKTYQDGVREGEWITYYPGGKQVQVKFNLKEGKLTGERIAYYKNGQERQRGTYIDSQPEGVVTEWDESGRKLVEVNFKNGKRHGKMTYWDEDGKPTVRNYDEGKLVQ